MGLLFDICFLLLNLLDLLKLSQKFTLPGTIRNVGLLSQLLGYNFSDADFQTDFDKWEDLKKKKYERDTRTSIPDSLLITLLTAKLREHFLLTCV